MLKVPRHRSGLEAETMAGFLLLEGRSVCVAVGRWWPANSCLQVDTKFPHLSLFQL